MGPRLLSANHSSARKEKHKSIQNARSACPSRIALSLLLVRSRNHISEKVVRVSEDDSDNATPRNSTDEPPSSPGLRSREEMNEEKSVGKKRRLQENHVQTHPEKGIPARPVVKDHEFQRDPDKYIGRHTQRPDERSHHA